MSEDMFNKVMGGPDALHTYSGATPTTGAVARFEAAKQELIAADFGGDEYVHWQAKWRIAPDEIADQILIRLMDAALAEQANISRAQSAVASEDIRDAQEKRITELWKMMAEKQAELDMRDKTISELQKELSDFREKMASIELEYDIKRKTIAELREKLDAIHCVFCGSVLQPDFDACKNHVLTCPKHPMRAVESKLATAEATIAEGDKILSRLVVPINGYDQRVMLEDTKNLLIKHAGYQNAYTVSNIIETIRLAIVRLGAVPSFAARAAQAPAYVPKPCPLCKKELTCVDTGLLVCRNEDCELTGAYTQAAITKLTGVSK